MHAKEYYELIDKEIKLIPLTFDVNFKAIMLKNTNLFLDFLIDTMKLNITKDDHYLFFLDKDLIKENYKEHGKIIDLNVKIGKDLLIDVEMNTKKYTVIKDRNQLFLEKLDTLSYDVGEDYDVLKNRYVYQLNINAYKHEDKNVGEKIVMYYDIKNKKVFSNRNKIFIKNLVFYRNEYYNKSTLLKKDELFLVALTSKNFTELYNVMKQILSPDDLNKFMEDVINMSKDEFVLHAWAKEAMDRLVEEKEQEEREKEKKEREKEKQKYEKEKQEYEKEKQKYEKEKQEYEKKKLRYENDIAKFMKEKEKYREEKEKYREEKEKYREEFLKIIKSLVNKGMTYKDISDITGKTIAEIREIEKSSD